jgi:hypothetical protein
VDGPLWVPRGPFDGGRAVGRGEAVRGREPVDVAGVADQRGGDHVTDPEDDLRWTKGRYPTFCQTEMWLRLSAVKGSRFQLLQRPRNDIPARRAMRSNSDGQA